MLAFFLNQPDIYPDAECFCTNKSCVPLLDFQKRQIFLLLKRNVKFYRKHSNEGFDKTYSNTLH